MSIKIKLPKQTNVLDLPDDYATLENVDPNGFFVFRFKYMLNPSHVSFLTKKNSNSVLIQLLDNVEKKTSVNMFTNSTSFDELYNNILTQSSRQKNYLANRENIIFWHNSDYTKKIPNSQTQNISRQNGKSLQVISPKQPTADRPSPVMFTRRTVSTRLVANLINANSNMPKFEINTAINNTNILKGLPAVKIGSKAIEKARKDILLKSNIDPAVLLGLRTNSIVTSKRSLAGLSVNKKPITKINKSVQKTIKNSGIQNLFNNKEKSLLKTKALNQNISSKYLKKVSDAISSPTNKLNIKKNLLLKSLGTIDEKSLPTISDVGTDEYISVPVLQTTHFVEIEEIVKIPISLLGYRNFKIRFELRSKAGVLVQREERVVDHEKHVNNLLIPALAPDIVLSSTSRPGKILIELTQNDDHASKILLYRRIIPTDEPIVDAAYSLIRTISLEKHQQPVRIEERLASVNPVIYRAVCANDQGVLGGEFASLVSNQERGKLGAKRSYLLRPSFVSLTHRNLFNKIELIVENIPVEPIAIQFFKRQLSLNEKVFSPITEVMLLTHGNEDTVTVYDDQVKDGRIYEYHARLIYEDGSVVVANNNLILQYEKLETNVLELKITPPATRINNGILDINFTIEKEINLSNMDYIKQLIVEQDLYDHYETDLTDNKEKLQNLFFVRVIRTNITTGEAEDFGIIKSNQFSDAAFSTVKNVKPLKQGSKYRYAIYAHSRTVESLISTIDTIKTNKNRTTYTYKASKFRHPVTLKEGNLVSEGSLTRNHAKTEFTFGDIVDIKYVDVDLGEVKTKITKVVASKLTENSNLIQWTINGNADAIDHFIIVMNLSGNKTVVGKCHNIANSSHFQFVDLLTNDETGGISYGVMPVYFDYSNGSEFLSNQIVI